MIFCGDVAIPASIITINIPEWLKTKPWAINLEGSLVENSESKDFLDLRGVFNNIEALEALCQQLNIQVCSIANNHIKDFKPVQITIEKLYGMGLKHVGAGGDVEEASKSVVVDSFRILSFGWDVIKCRVANKNTDGVNPYTKENVLRCVDESLRENEKLICLFHWGYELEALPQPYDRRLAHELIDRGVYSVIGCHAHRVQPIEMYKGRPIVYGLGNFLFPHRLYGKGHLRFPNFTSKELAFEVTTNGQFIAHWFEYDIEHRNLCYMDSETIIPSQKEYEGVASFSGMSDREYDVYFRQNRYHRKLIPIFRSNESKLKFMTKSYYVKWRGKMIDQLVKLDLK